MKNRLFAFPLLLALGFAAPASAHGLLDSATPAADAALAAAPEEILLVFTEEIELPLSRLSLRDAAGKAVEISAPAHDEGDPRTLRAALPKLAPGAYQVDWGVTSVDTHSTQGSYGFTLK